MNYVYFKRINSKVYNPIFKFDINSVIHEINKLDI